MTNLLNVYGSLGIAASHAHSGSGGVGGGISTTASHTGANTEGIQTSSEVPVPDHSEGTTGHGLFSRQPLVVIVAVLLGTAALALLFVFSQSDQPLIELVWSLRERTITALVEGLPMWLFDGGETESGSGSGSGQSVLVSDSLLGYQQSKA